MKRIKIILGLVLFASVTTFAQSPRIKLNQITKDSLTGSVLISSPTDSGMVYSRDLFISYGADTFLILGGDTLAATSGIISSVLSDGVTITGDGTIGSELTVDTNTVIATKQDLNNIDLTSQVTGTLPIANGGTGQSTLAAAGIVTGTGTTNYIPKFTSSSAIGNSQIFDNSGNILIGTTSNSEGAKLKIEGGYVYLKESGGANVFLRSAYDPNTAAIQVQSASDLVFCTSNITRMTLDSDGKLGIGTTSPSYDLHVVDDIFASDSIIGTSFVGTSDSRLKQDIELINNGLENVLKLNPVSYRYITDVNNVNKRFGFIAQEVEAYLPNLVSERFDGMKLLNYLDIIPINTKAIQEQQAIIESIQSKLDAKSSIIDQQATEIETLKTLITELSNRLTIIKNN